MLVAGEQINTHLSAGACADARDGLAKAVYLAVLDLVSSGAAPL